MKIAVVGLGYVGLSNAVLLAQPKHVTAIDISEERFALANADNSPIVDAGLETLLGEKKLHLAATTDAESAHGNADYVTMITPANYDPKFNSIDTSSVEAVVRRVIAVNSNACIVIKLTILVGYLASVRENLETDRVIFVPELLREGQALYDNLYSSRIIVGEQSERATIFAILLLEGAVKKDVEILYADTNEAERIKLFANAYLAMLVAFFNEHDNYSIAGGMDCRQINEGVSLDPRIGADYNNSSFGYGGYCVPKDSKPILANYSHVTQNLMRTTVDANRTRKDNLADQIQMTGSRTVGIYRLAIKAGPDNFRKSSVQRIMKRLKAKGVETIVFKPMLEEEDFFRSRVVRDFQYSKVNCDVIVANRVTEQIEDVADKVFTRDLFGGN